ncbi:multidrug efflux pump subunit AcrA (membrane-fusion protein) [Mesorhizobium shonense]|uniref:Multidrug efflux pump subunit AcrA (Membrane-fusion protein) n=1 Tax=Mesorhizobium shonense TaxID=1209948 RepID=A0ABV2HRJ7_9HYPH
MHQLAVHTVGGVITPGEVVMLIVPVADELTVEARVAPQDIDQLKPGQEARLKFSAFNQRVTPELNGNVNEIWRRFDSGCRIRTGRIKRGSNR